MSNRLAAMDAHGVGRACGASLVASNPSTDGVGPVLMAAQLESKVSSTTLLQHQLLLPNPIEANSKSTVLYYTLKIYYRLNKLLLPTVTP